MTTSDIAPRLAAHLDAPADPAHFAAFVLRTKSHQGLEVMAHAATGGRLGYTDLRAAAGSEPDRSEGLALPWLRHLARVVALVDEKDTPTALALFDLAAKTDDATEFEPENADAYGQLLLRSGRITDLEHYLDQLPLSDSVRWSLRADRLNPFLTGATDEAEWLAILNEPFRRGGLAPVRVDTGGPAEPFAGLAAEPIQPCAAPDLVTVIMPAYRPDASIEAAVRSILGQTWQHLELIVVDDASPAEYRATFDRIEALDARVRVVRASDNGGTYPARNIGLSEARGRYITFQDADDWSHPQRIERQVRVLEQDPDLLASRSRAVRAYPDLSFTYPGYPPDRLNASSLLFRTEPVLSRLGRFDHVRKSADMEFPLRLRSVVRSSVLDMPDPPLAITQLRPGSLSRADATPGWIHWSRIAYRDAYQRWHQDIRNGTTTGRLEPDSPRPFPLPQQNWAPARTTETPQHYDVVVLNDWRRHLRGIPRLLDEISLMQRAGLRVAIAHAETPTPLAERRPVPSPFMQRKVNDGELALVHLSQDVQARLLYVANPVTLQFISATPQLRAESVAVAVASDALTPVDGRAFAPNDCSTTSERLFGRTPTWVARDQLAEAYLRENVPDTTAPWLTLPTAVDVTGLKVHRRRRGPRPVVGHHPVEALVAGSKGIEELLLVFPDDDSLDVRFRGRSKPLLQALKRRTPLPAWLVYPHESLALRNYLAQLDFFVSPRRELTRMEDHQAVLEAMAAGCAAVLHPAHRQTYGDAAVYAQPEAMADTVVTLFAEPEALAEQQRRGRRFAEKRYEDYLATLSVLLSEALGSSPHDGASSEGSRREVS